MAFERPSAPQHAIASTDQLTPISMPQTRSSDDNIALNGDLKIDTGFTHVWGREIHDDARHQSLIRSARTPSHHYAIQPGLLPIFAETYFENCYAFCPVLDRATILAELDCPLLANALALAASYVQPPMLPHDGPTAYYNKARNMFYDDDEPDILMNLKAVLLFYWWAPRSTSAVHRHSSWWWTSIVIRHAHMLNIHRDTAGGTQDVVSRLRRRIWWTAFARERLTALCQSKPVIINLQECTIPGPSLDDFEYCEQDRAKQQVFVHWVRLCRTVGDIAQHTSLARTSTVSFPAPLAADLVSWVRSLPQHLKLPITSSHTAFFNKDAHQLHLPYLATIMVLYLNRPRGLGKLPQALPPAIMAATCMARAFKDILARGDTRFLMAITSWYSGVCFITLLSASREALLREAALADLAIVELLCKQLRNMWASATVIYNGFDRLRELATGDTSSSCLAGSLSSFNCSPSGGPDWKELFPFATHETSTLSSLVLQTSELSTTDAYNDLLPDSSLLDLQDWFTQLGDTDFMLPVDNMAFN